MEDNKVNLKYVARALRLWPRQVLRGLSRSGLAIFTLAAIFLAVCIPLCWLDSKDSLRYSGLMLQLLGLVTAAWGIRDTRKKFGHPSLLEAFRNLIRSMIPVIKNKEIKASSSVGCQISMKGNVKVWRTVEKDASLEIRVKALAENLDETYNQLNNLENEVKSQLSSISSKLEREGAERKKQGRDLDKKIELASTDGLHLATAGVVWLFFGIVFSTIPGEIFLIWANIVG